MLRRALTVTVCLVAISASAFGETMVVRLRDGRTITGQVEKINDGKEYKITRFVGGRPVMTLTVKVSEVLEMKKASLPTDEYTERLKRIDPNKAEDHFKLAQWAHRKGMLKIAVHELETALKLKPNYERASLLLKQLKARIGSGNGGQIEPPDNGGGTKVTPADRKGMITERDMNRIRLGELANTALVRKSFLGGPIEFRGKEQVRVTFAKNVVGRFVEAMRNDDDFRVDPKKAGDAFRRWSDQDRLAYMLSRLDRADWGMKDDIIIRTDPKSIRTFHRTIWPVLSKSCGSTKCHGAAKGQGKLKLFKIKSNDSLGLYSNFLILDMFAKGGRMIHRDFPRESLLLEAGLPAREAKWKHPDKAKARPTFQSVTDPRYKAALKWIELLNGPPRPVYGVEYKPPFGPDPNANSALKPKKTPSALP